MDDKKNWQVGEGAPEVGNWIRGLPSTVSVVGLSRVRGRTRQNTRMLPFSSCGGRDGS